jgi:hypothetical protein
MKHKAIYFVILILSVGLFSCNDDPASKITITNSASNDVALNFRGTLTEIPAGTSVELTNVLQGEYEYETIFELPAGATSAETSESCAGTFIIGPGTRILVVYISILDGSIYKLSASITSSNNLDEEGLLPNPIGP